MSFSKLSTVSSNAILENADPSLSLRVTRAFVAIVLIACVLLAPVCGQSNQPTCGKRKVNTAFLVHRGTQSRQGDWPWYAALYLPVQHKLTLSCGGSIIDKNTILTAAHCLFSNVRPLEANDISVHVGRIDLNDFTSALQVLIVSRLIIHPEFKILNVTHDIALVKLSNDIVMTQYVQPVCLWRMDDAQSQIVGKSGTVVGFGRNEGDELPGFLQEATLTVVDVITCLLSDRETYGAVLTHNMFCAGGEAGVSACNGDSGGGMFFEKDGTWYVSGIVSFIASRPNGLCDSSKYTIFTDVRKYLDWISQSQSTVSPMRLTQLETSKRVVSSNTMGNTPNRFGHRFLLVSEYDYIIRVPLNGGQGFKVTETSSAIAIDHDCPEGRFYWSDTQEKRIHSAKYDGTDQKPFITKDIKAPEGVAVDWISRRLYWTDSGKQTIEVASLDNPDMRRELISEGLVNPFCIAIDPFKSKLYWSDWNLGEPKIEWSNLDGSERQRLVSSPQVKDVKSIQVSMASGELCYTDAGRDKIECIYPYSKQIRTVASNVTELFGLAVTDELLYWTAQNMESIESINLKGVRQKPITSGLFEYRTMYAMTAVTENCAHFHSPCAINNGDCPDNTICLVNPRAPLGRSCK